MLVYLHESLDNEYTYNKAAGIAFTIDDRKIYSVALIFRVSLLYIAVALVQLDELGTLFKILLLLRSNHDQ